MHDTDIPTGFPNDHITAGPDEVTRLMGWAKAAFAGAPLETCDALLIKPTHLPFSFKLNGVSSSEFMARWHHSSVSTELDDKLVIDAEWSEPATGLTVTAEVKVFKKYAAIDWLLRFENKGKAETPIIEDIKTVDIILNTNSRECAPVLHQLHGDSCGGQSFAPFDTELFWPGQVLTMAPSGGRPSNATAFPFFDLEYEGQGVITAIGWSGQWSASYHRSDDKLQTAFCAGQELTHMQLQPGESIRTPRVLLMPWEGDRAQAHNRFRRLMMSEYLPKPNGHLINMPVVLQTFDLYHNFCTDHVDYPDWATEAGQIEAVEAAHRLGCDTYWFDAGWFVGDFPAGVGNWFCKPKEFPNGLKPVSDRCHELGMKFVLWFEPCRVAPNTQIAYEHPEWLLGDASADRLFNLGIPEARRWMTDMLSSRITEFGVDVYREDFNIDPLGFWRSCDASNRQGMAEIRFIEGHYAMWDELLERHPGLWIDNCASGGRRIDLETISRSVPLWRSDTGCFSGHPEWNQLQSAALSQYLPLHTACGWSHDAYTLRSSATSGVIVQLPYHDEGFPFEEARQAIAEVEQCRKYWYGDFYNLTGVTSTVDDMIAYQFHRADLDAGVVYVYRRQLCLYSGLVLTFQGLDNAAGYQLEVIDDHRRVVQSVECTGAQLMEEGFEVRLPKRSSVIIRYHQLTSGG